MPSTGRNERPVIPVAAGCIFNDRGEVLICQRPAGKIAAGKWEFPGGKIESGETARQALDRELHEELGLYVCTARPLIRVSHDYSDRRVILDTWRVETFDGTPQAHDGQAFDWVRPENLRQWDLLAADAPIVSALRLPAHYVLTPEQATPEQLLAGLSRLPANALLRLRMPALDNDGYAQLAARLVAEGAPHRIRLMLDRSPEMVLELGAAGLHLRARDLAVFKTRPLSSDYWIAASCHDETEVAQARALGADFCVVGPVSATATHPGAPALGWARFQELALALSRPTYAIGGLDAGELDHAREHGAQGVAGIRAYWSFGSESGACASSPATR